MSEPERTRLSHLWPRMTVKGREATEARLACKCWTCQYFRRQDTVDKPFTATLRKRNIQGRVAVWLQCDGCGRAVGGALSRQEHFLWQSYADWDADLEKSHNVQAEALRAQSVKAWDDQQKELQRIREQRRSDYDEWLKTSPDWHEMRKKVLERCRWICEGCLSARAVQVHHETYELGKLPPAWLLRGICANCHKAIHAGWRDEDE